MQDSHINDDVARHNVKVLVFAQAILGAQMPMLFTVSGLAGQTLAPIPCFATLGISVLFFGSMLTAPVLSSMMQRFGRRAGFAFGVFAGMVGALVSAYGIYLGSFAIFLLGSFLSGIYHPAQSFFRFAATDNASAAYRPKAISYVLAGGLVAAIIGPQLVKVTFEAFGAVFIGTYLAIAVLNGLGIWIFLFLKPNGLPRVQPEGQKNLRSYREILTTPGIVVAMICGLVTYSLMTFMMTSAPLAVVGCGYSANHAADVVMAHVLAMFVPSFFTGHLINRFGAKTIVATGLAILVGAAVVAMSGIELIHFYGALILLGIGWNFGFIGATTMLTSQHTPEERGRVQGLNDFVLIGALMISSLASGGIMNCAGSDAVAGWGAVALAMFPLLAVAFGTLFWFSRRQSSQAI